MLYEVAILEKPTTKQAEEGKVERLILGPKAVIANDPQGAAIAAVQGNGDLNADISRLEVLVRPFAGA